MEYKKRARNGICVYCWIQHSPAIKKWFGKRFGKLIVIEYVGK